MRADRLKTTADASGGRGPLVKICGNLYSEQALLVASHRPDFMGWIFSPRSPRKIAPEDAGAIIRRIRNEYPSIKQVGVFADNSVEEIVRIARQIKDLDLVQTTGTSTFIVRLRELLQRLESEGVRPPGVLPVIRVSGVLTDADLASYGEVPFFVFDTYVKGQAGGTGKRFPLEWISGIKTPFFLAGGLRPDNLKEVLSEIRPVGLDVSSGIEDSPGIKNPDLLKRFLQIARNGNPDTK